MDKKFTKIGKKQYIFSQSEMYVTTVDYSVNISIKNILWANYDSAHEFQWQNLIHNH